MRRLVLILATAFTLVYCQDSRVGSRFPSSSSQNSNAVRRVSRLQLTPFNRVDRGNRGNRVSSNRVEPVFTTSRPEEEANLTPVSSDDLAIAIAAATQSINALEALEREILEKGLFPKANSAASLHNSNSRTSEKAKQESVSAMVAIEATRELAERLDLDSNDIARLQLLNVTNSLLNNICPYTEILTPCVPHKYRPANGDCNNAIHPRWGSSHILMRRMLPPVYDDGVQFPRRRSVTGSPLPNPRVLSLSLHPTTSDLHDKISLMVMQFGQFLDHDITLTPFATGADNTALDCCSEELQGHPECTPISVPQDDPFYAQYDQYCINFARSIPAPRFGCALGTREQLNQLTSVIDASNVYGSTNDEATRLRSFVGGQLRNKVHPGGSHFKHMLPSNPDDGDCKKVRKSEKCFMSGDARVNEHVGLMSMHTLWMREHNRIATELAELNPHWTDEILYQETRRILAAMLQHITFNEWLPIILGREEISRHTEDLELVNNDYYDGYDIDTDPSVFNEFASAAFRFGHTLIPSFINRVSPPLTHAEPLLFRDAFFNPSTMYRTDDTGGIDSVLRGLSAQNVERSDMKISTEVREHLFQEVDKPYGLDLVSLNLQRGRDHGIPGYNAYRSLCGLRRARNFDDLRDVMSEDTIRAFSAVYAHVDDIDLFSGGLSERKLNGALLGPTFACIVGRQFTALRRGDRYWYENQDPVSKFSIEQLEEIRKMTASRIICNSADNITIVQPNVFLMPDKFMNDFITCSQIPSLNLSKWIDEDFKQPLKLPADLVARSVLAATNNIQQLARVEKQAYELGYGQVMDPRDSLSRHAAFLKSSPYIQLLSETSKVLINATELIANYGQLTRADILERLSSVQLPDTIVPPEPEKCIAPVPFVACDLTSKYREITGRCNNIEKPELGVGLKPLKRLLPPTYDDGINTLKVSTGTRNLPSTRDVSITVHENIDKPHLEYTLALMQWGQFLDHDITLTPLSRGFNNSVLNCSRCDSFETVSSECVPIGIPENDPFFPSFVDGQPHCMSFARSSPISLSFGPREQMNAITAYIDASNVYGSDACRQEALREFRGGLLRIQPSLGGLKPLMPTRDFDDDCEAEDKSTCYLAGDIRANEQPVLALMHTIWMREHNRIATQLSTINSHWNDEQLYEESRRIVGAMNQHITYNEFLPRVLGREIMNSYGLTLEHSGYYNGYNKDCDATITNEFATAAFRFGHSLIRDGFKRFDTVFRETYPPVDLLGNFFNPKVLTEVNNGGMDSLIRGLITVVAQSADRFIVKRLTDHLFEDPHKPKSGMDLAAMNIQRGRDHGLPQYNDYRVHCGLPRANRFSDLRNEISDEEIINKLRSVYGDVDDIDLFTGGLAEDPVQGGLVGPTFACIIAEQFQRLRKCDRFWYETKDPVTKFTATQLAELRKTTLAKVLCENSDSIPVIHPYVMSLPDDVLNAPIACNTLKGPELEHWRESAFCSGVGGASGRVRAGTTQMISPCKACACPRSGGTAICSTLRITNCYELLASFSSDELRMDNACVTQCAYVVRAFLVETPTNIGRDRELSNFLSSFDRTEPLGNIRLQTATNTFTFGSRK